MSTAVPTPAQLAHIADSSAFAAALSQVIEHHNGVPQPSSALFTYFSEAAGSIPPGSLRHATLLCCVACYSGNPDHVAQAQAHWQSVAA